MASKSIGKFPKHIAWRKVDDEVVVLNLETNVYYSFNQTAGAVWELIGEGYTQEEIVEEILETYSSTAKTVTKDVADTIKKIKKEKLLEEA